MTALAQQIRETPMAPYVGLMRGMSSKQKLVVVAFLVDSMKEAADAPPAGKTNAKAQSLQELQTR
ncbi:MAG: hypothetical protein IJS59_10485 [Bacteroidaceae bacterium]|nr:hypothetical protein [Bacteroidaceae bacterium]